jgi:hypothetical protein
MQPRQQNHQLHPPLSIGFLVSSNFERKKNRSNYTFWTQNDALTLIINDSCHRPSKFAHSLSRRQKRGQGQPARCSSQSAVLPRCHLMGGPTFRGLMSVRNSSACAALIAVGGFFIFHLKREQEARKCLYT